MRYGGGALVLLAFALALVAASPAGAQDPGDNPLGLNITEGVDAATEPGQIGATLTLVFVVTILGLAPAILVMTTSFTRIIIVLGFLRQALATQQSPPNQVLIGLALFLTFFIMAPTYIEVNQEALQPYLEEEIGQAEAVERALIPIREFMFRQTEPKDLALFINIADMERPGTPDDVPLHVLMPSFVLSELTTAFIMGFYIYIPFLIIDMVVASTLMSMGMMMLPPIFVSLPFKIIMFVLADGWYLIVGSLVESFN
ncbi:MAG: flagellar type III secretion system pore protein FliP [Candidatus Hydrogenedentota bacterium]